MSWWTVYRWTDVASLPHFTTDTQCHNLQSVKLIWQASSIRNNLHDLFIMLISGCSHQYQICFLSLQPCHKTSYTETSLMKNLWVANVLLLFKHLKKRYLMNRNIYHIAVLHWRVVFDGKPCLHFNRRIIWNATH